MKRAALYALIGAVWVFIGVKLLFNSGDATAVVPAAQLPVPTLHLKPFMSMIWPPEGGA